MSANGSMEDAAYSVATPLRSSSGRNSLVPPSPKVAFEAKMDIEHMKAQLDAMGQKLTMYGDAAAESEAMQDKVRELSRKLESSEEEVKKRSREVWETRARLESQRKELLREREAFQTQAQQLAAARDENDELRARIEELEARLRSAEQSACDETERLRLAHADLQAEHASNKARLGELAPKADALERELSDERAAALQLREDAAAAHARAHELQQKLASSVGSQTEAAARAAETEERIKRLQQFQSEADARYKAQIEKMEDELAALRASAQTDQEAVRQATAHVTELESLNGHAQASAAEAASRADTLQRELEQAHDAHAAAVAELRDAHAAAVADAAQTARATAAQDAAAQLQALRRESEEASRLAQEAADARAAEAQERAEALQQEALGFQRDLDELEAKARKALAGEAQAEARAQALLSELDGAAEVEARAEGLTRELEASQAEVQRLQSQTASERRRADETEAAVARLQAAADMMQQEKDRLAQELASLRLKEPRRLSRGGNSPPTSVPAGGAGSTSSPKGQNSPMAPPKGQNSPMAPAPVNLEGITPGCEQSRELLLTLIQLKQDCEQTETENRSLKAVMSAFDSELFRHADTIGHVNHKQKIRYTMQLKEQISTLLGELKAARQHILRLQTGKMNESLLDALASLGMSSGGPASEGASTLSARGDRRGRRQTIGGVGYGSGPSSFPRDEEEEDRERKLQEAELRCQQHEQSLERIGVDFLHLKALVERVVMLADGDGLPGSASFAELLARLRKAIEGAKEDGWRGVVDQVFIGTPCPSP
eukprot:TRINITY_DN14394_c0_g3_i1.p1 TRINITY_DN14394_c0_g3~~TRINITY_DN14394_c0_g3_i1.p1  ORF type:complete len:786 (-),score=250.27 TRINITY_DN14394_c0_g3_i1:115-2472(-)